METVSTVFRFHILEIGNGESAFGSATIFEECLEHIVFASPVVWIVLTAVDVVDYSGEKFPFSVESTLGSGIDFGNSLACEISVGKPALEFIAVFVGSIEGEFFGYCFGVAVVEAPCREVVLFLAIFGKRRAFRPRL